MNKRFLMFLFLGFVCVFLSLSVSAECIDSDGGVDPYTKGNVFFNVSFRAVPLFAEDFCDCPGSLIVQEYFCDDEGIYSIKSIVCEYGCDNGACLKCVATGEVCNGIDDDCNNIVDDGDLCPNNQECINEECVSSENVDMYCIDSDGTNTYIAGNVSFKNEFSEDVYYDDCCPMGVSEWQCIDGNPVLSDKSFCEYGCANEGACRICTPSTEVCNGIDDNCNERVDEGDLCSSGAACIDGECKQGYSEIIVYSPIDLWFPATMDLEGIVRLSSFPKDTIVNITLIDGRGLDYSYTLEEDPSDDQSFSYLLKWNEGFIQDERIEYYFNANFNGVRYISDRHEMKFVFNKNYFSCEKIIDNGPDDDKITIFGVLSRYPQNKFDEADQEFYDLFYSEKGGLFTLAPFEENRDKFNVYLVKSDLEFDTNGKGGLPLDFDNLENFVSSLCGDVSANQIALLNYYTDLASMGFPQSNNYTGLLYVRRNNPCLFSHEMGHSFGDLKDEYFFDDRNPSIRIDWNKPFIPLGPNRDNEGCPKWCSGKLDTGKTLCYSSYIGLKECSFVHLEEYYNSIGTTEMVIYGSDYDRLQEELNICYKENVELNKGNFESTTGNFLDCDLGVECIEYSGCYVGAQSLGYFRSSQDSIMNSADAGDCSGYGVISEGILQDKISYLFNRKISNQRSEVDVSNGSKFVATSEQNKEGGIGFCDGCFLNEKCYPFNYRKDREYCHIDKKFVKQIEKEEMCENNFECMSNLCIDNECIDSGFFRKIMNWFKTLF